MTSLPANISPLRQRMIDDMRMRQLAPKTQDIYLHIVREFARFLGRSPDTATVEDLRRYQLYLVDHGTSAVSLNHAITGLKFFFTVTLDRPELMVSMHPCTCPADCPLYSAGASSKRSKWPSGTASCSSSASTGLARPATFARWWRRYVPANRWSTPSARSPDPKRCSGTSHTRRTASPSPTSA